MYNFEVKIDNKVHKFEMEEDKKGIEMKTKIIELADISIDACNLKVFAAGHYVKDDVPLKDQINKEKLKIVLAKYEKKDLKPVSSPPKKQIKLDNQTSPKQTQNVISNNINLNNNNTTSAAMDLGEDVITINNNNQLNNNINFNNNNNFNNEFNSNFNLNNTLFGEENLSEEVLNFRKREWEARKTVEKLVEISHKIASRQGNSYDNETFAVLTDSEGKEFPLSEKDRIGITCGQMLYNFGKKKLFNDKNYDDALKIFEASEREFLQVSEEILQLIDNYGLLCLDIAWAYYQMQKIEQLQNASQKIKTANEFLEKSYGKEMERLMKVTGGFAPQKVLYARLHLLQGIIRFHKGLFKDAISYLKQAEDEINQFRIDPNDKDFVELLSIGYDEISARKGLRAANRDLNGAIQFLSDEQEKRKEIEKKESEREEKRRREMSYGATAKGKRINLRLLQTYVEEMGYKEEVVVEALKQVDNDEDALSDLLTDPSRLQLLETSISLKKEENRKKILLKEKRKKEKEIILNCKKMIEFGFSESLSLSALQQTEGDVEKAILLLTESPHLFTENENPFSLSQLEEQFNSIISSSSSSSSSSFLPNDENTPSLSNLLQDPLLNIGEGEGEGEGESMIDEKQPPKEEDLKQLEEQKRQKEEEKLNYEMEDELKEAVNIHEGDYLNLTLEDEYHIFIKYKSLLESRNEWY